MQELENEPRALPEQAGKLPSEARGMCSCPILQHPCAPASHQSKGFKPILPHNDLKKLVGNVTGAGEGEFSISLVLETLEGDEDTQAT